MWRIAAQRKIGGRYDVLSILLLLALAAISGRAFPAPARDEIPAGIDEAEYNRLRRPGTGQGLPDFLSPEALVGLSDQVIAALRRDFAERGRLQVQSDRYLDYDEERNIIYSNARTRIRFDQYMLEADRVLVQVPLQEIQAEGNVILRAWKDPAMKMKTDEIYCKSIVFNYKYFQGAAAEARGQRDVLYFRCKPSPSGLPGFQMIGRDEALFRNADFTTDDFPDPQYTMHTADGILVFNDRIFVRNAVLRVRHIPILWLPAYTKSLREPIPWSVVFGYSNRLGAYASVRYDYWHYRYEPSFDDPNDLLVRDSSRAEARIDLFSKRGVGVGLDYSYSFDFDKHRGNVQLYGMPSDRYRQVPEGGDTSRWQLFARHRSALRKDLTLQVNVDYMSDPELYYDLFDPLRQEDRWRVPERRARAALTYWKDDYIARVLVEAKERVTRDRITNTAEPGDDDADYDLFPGTPNARRHRLRDGLPSSRYGLVSLRLPQVTFATNHVRIGGQSPLFYTIDINAFNNLDKGLNFNSTRDDSFVVGLDVYQQLSYLFRFSERYTLLAQVGAGLGFMKRLDDSYHFQRDDFRREDGTFRSDITFVDDSTFRIGHPLTVNENLLGPSGRLFKMESGREVSLNDYQPGFAYADAKLRFQGRFTDSLTGNVYYILREGVKNSLGEFYESIGNRTARDDLYDYRIRKHWISADLTHHLAYPDITTMLAAGRNLQGRSDIYANEPIHYAMVSSQYRNEARTFRLRGYISFEQRQIRNSDDPNQYQRDAVVGGLAAAYAPVHRRWWVEVDSFVWKALTADPLGQTPEVQRARRNDDFYYFNETDADIAFDVWVGRKLGEKWTVELGAEYRKRYNGLNDVRLTLTRDLHNALAQMQVRYRRSIWKTSNDNGNVADINVNFNIQFKLPGPMDTVMAPRARTLMAERRALEIAENDPLLGI